MRTLTDMSAEKAAAIACLLLGTGTVLADEADMPDPDFLEYLGFWEESDEDWLLFDEPVTAEVEDTRSEPAPEGEESTEKSDEN
jgi:hypothetical protein